MKLTFDARGNLKPYAITEVSQEAFREALVDAFEPGSSRHVLYQRYSRYTHELSRLLNESYHQWIDGSFVSTKINPKDIDLVTMINYQDYEKHQGRIDAAFVGGKARKHFQVDAYVVPVYPEDHRKSVFIVSDQVYWQSLFGRTRMSRAKKQYQKGFVQPNFE